MSFSKPFVLYVLKQSQNTFLRVHSEYKPSNHPLTASRADRSLRHSCVSGPFTALELRRSGPLVLTGSGGLSWPSAQLVQHEQEPPEWVALLLIYLITVVFSVIAHVLLEAHKQTSVQVFAY